MTSRILPSEAHKILDSAGFVPLEEYPGKANVPWKCKCKICGDISSKRISIIKTRPGCRSCQGFKKVDEKLAREVMIKAGFIPLEPYPGSSGKWKCKCSKCSKLSTPTYDNVKHGNSKCKYCSGRHRIPEEEAISVFENAGFEVLGKYKDSQSPIECRCITCGLVSSPRLTTVKAGRRCKFCNYGGKDSFSQEVADKAFIEKGMKPLEKYIDSKTPRKCECAACGAVCYPRLSNLRRWGGCGNCASIENAAKKRTPEDVAIEIMSQADLVPLEKYTNNSTPWLCECLVCGTHVKPTFKYVKANGSGCKICAWSRNGINSRHEEEDVRKVFELAGLDPIEPYERRHAPWKSKCRNCGNEVAPSLATVVRGGACRFCAAPEMGSLLYLIMHEKLHSYKIGRGNKSRVNEHKRHGWQVLATWDLETPRNAISVEQKVLSFVRIEMGIPQFLNHEQMKSTGATETFSLDTMEESEIRNLVAGFVRDFNEEFRGA
jgi:hypothetical protein